jgi:hypothetical protein
MAVMVVLIAGNGDELGLKVTARPSESSSMQEQT